MLPVRTKNPLENPSFFVCWVRKYELVFRTAQLGSNVSIAITPSTEIILYKGMEKETELFEGEIPYSDGISESLSNFFNILSLNLNFETDSRLPQMVFTS